MTEREKESAVSLLTAEGCSCVVRKGDVIRLFRGRGVFDLLGLLHDEPDFLRGAFVADKIVGKGAAALMVAGGVEGLYADVISAPAQELLAEAGIEVRSRVQTPNIINRTGDDICPVEKLCADCRTAAECVPVVERFAASVRKSQ